MVNFIATSESEHLKARGISPFVKVDGLEEFAFVVCYQKLAWSSYAVEINEAR
jgi:hypothetical protein